GDLLLDHGNHFDAEIIGLQEAFERRDGGGIAAIAERGNDGFAYREARLGEIGRDEASQLLIFLVEASKAGDGGHAGRNRLANRGPFTEERNGLVVAEIAEGAK